MKWEGIPGYSGATSRSSILEIDDRNVNKMVNEGRCLRCDTGSNVGDRQEKNDEAMRDNDDGLWTRSREGIWGIVGDGFITWQGLPEQ